MKFIITLLLTTSLLMACGVQETESSVVESVPDLDLTAMSSTVAFAALSNVMTTPDDYVEKQIKITGVYTTFFDEYTGNTYHLISMVDDTGCCYQGMEFTSIDGEYPAENSEITVQGEFSLYTENDFLYCELDNATILEINTIP